MTRQAKAKVSLEINMTADKINQWLQQATQRVGETLAQPETYSQLLIVIIVYLVAFFVARRIRHFLPIFEPCSGGDAQQPLRQLCGKLGSLLFPLLAIMLLRISVEISATLLQHHWVNQAAMSVSVLLLFHSIVRDFISNNVVAGLFRWIGMPLIVLFLLGLLDDLVAILESVSINIGNIDISLYGILRVTLFGSLLFWLGRVSSKTGRDIIHRQQNLEVRTREVAAKMLEMGIFFVIFMLLLQVMGINLTALAVFGGALGVGIGIGLQAIASNFISGIIILFDRSVSIGDYVELEDGRTGVVRQLNMRSTTMETFDGKDIVVPNEKFIVESFTNWTHKDQRQRYRVDFSVAYHSDIRKLVDIIKQVVASHPQVLSGEEVPFEERPDCEIDSFGDSGINMFVEFWMEGIDDGKNRVGGDLLLMILEALQEHGYEIPFPQREVRVLNETGSAR
jgi:small-conductance mechanosensitive channel